MIYNFHLFPLHFCGMNKFYEILSSINSQGFIVIRGS